MIKKLTNFNLKKLIVDFFKNLKDQFRQVKDISNPVNSPNSLIIKPAIHAPYSLYRFEGVFSDA